MDLSIQKLNPLCALFIFSLLLLHLEKQKTLQKYTSNLLNLSG